MSNVENERAQITSMLLAWAAKRDGVPSENDLASALMGLAPLFGPNLSDQDIQDIMDEIARVFAIDMDLGVLIEAKGHQPWLLARQDSIDWQLWNAYSQFLLNDGRSPVVLDKLNSSLDRILDHLGDPFDSGPWKRRGLVIGDVQSGKTGTYIGLMDKAADAGYRIFVVLTGNTESLRQQTQGRIDEGVLGQDTKPLIKGKAHIANKPTAIGVGLLADLKNSVASMTTMTTDFRKTGLEAMAFRPGQDTLMVFITKKNKTVLDNIGEWLGRQANVDGKIQVPLLLLDDEADFASINTKRDDEDPTAINAAIRRILSQFARSSYVGFTATPFANIFINDEIEEDLFPRDFIYGLDSPSNYVGPSSLFSSTSVDAGDKTLCILDDAEAIFPLGHKNSLEVSAIPESLKRAIRVFLLANAIRDISGHSKAPRSMLVNVSRFNLVQAQIGRLVEDELARYRNTIRLHGRMYATGVPNRDLDLLRETYELEYVGEAGTTWDDVLRQLPVSVAEIGVRVMNSKRDKELEARMLRAENPPRTIAIGGDLLSRGLTLEGLMTSYFYRKVAASDTLMQMGRWFGYRDNYSSLTRIWITAEMVADYASTADSLEELRLELLRMSDQGLTPRQYGLAVKNHPSALLITARNKMRTAVIGKKSISLRGRAIETPKISASDADIRANYNALSDLVSELRSRHAGTEERAPKANRVIWRGVNKAVVAKMLSAYEAPVTVPLFAKSSISDFVAGAEAEDLQTWDVALIGGSGRPAQISNLDINCARRKLERGLGSYLVSGRRQRVAGTGDVAVTQSEARRALATESFLRASSNKGRTVPDREYIPYLERPLLLLYPIHGSFDDGDDQALPDIPLVGLVVAIPERIGPDGLRPPSEDRSADVTYMLNTPAQRLLLEDFDDLDEGEFGV
ncbi:Z1 domain-containing protein [Agromyces cerinus]|uniref:Z1 domain-containing protein n=1 Tax=Agromyces cerinus subsp. cerinus TaxID=232089 RepID=A0A1N6F1Z0_9MICO|nr:Z1 domain-containing protein [Agromyces cerinus]SIN89300.1 Z1 domain-containing protein [Agromyces cerinus subsp. cerinus]